MTSPIVIDASVAVKWVVPEDGSPAALALRVRYSFVAPQLILAEIANILWKKHQRRELSGDEADVAMGLLLMAGIEYIAMDDIAVDAVKLAVRLEHPAYDCMYIATAMQMKCPLVTADQRLVRKLADAKLKDVVCQDLASMPQG